jgi:hypothetical protein
MEHLNVDLTAVSVVGTVFVTCAIMVATVLYFVHRARELRYKTIQLALEKGQPLPPEDGSCRSRQATSTPDARQPPQLAPARSRFVGSVGSPQGVHSAANASESEQELLGA